MNRDVGRHPRPDRRPSARRRARHVNAWSMLAGLAVVLASGTGPASGRAWQEPAPAVRPPTGRAGRHGAAGVEPSDPRCAAVCAWPAAAGEVRAGGRGIPAVPGGPARGRRSDRRPLRPGQRPAQPGPLCRILAGLRRFPRRGAPRSPFAHRAVSRGRTLLPDRQPARRTPRPRGVHGGEGRSSGAGDGLDLPGRCPLRPERPPRGAVGLRTVAGGLSPGPARRSRPIRPGADPGGVGRAATGRCACSASWPAAADRTGLTAPGSRSARSSSLPAGRAPPSRPSRRWSAPSPRAH